MYPGHIIITYEWQPISVSKRIFKDNASQFREVRLSNKLKFKWLVKLDLN